MRVRNLPACLKLKGKFPVSKVILLTCWFSSTWQKNALLFQSFRTVYSLWWVFCLFVLFILYVCLVFLFVCFALYIIFDKNYLMCGKLLVKLPMNLSLRIFYFRIYCYAITKGSHLLSFINLPPVLCLSLSIADVCWHFYLWTCNFL